MTDEAIHTFMLAYQARYGAPPKMKDIVAATGVTINHRSSVFYALHRLQDKGLVREIRPACYARRYLAVEE